MHTYMYIYTSTHAHNSHIHTYAHNAHAQMRAHTHTHTPSVWGQLSLVLVNFILAYPNDLVVIDLYNLSTVTTSHIH